MMVAARKLALVYAGVVLGLVADVLAEAPVAVTAETVRTLQSRFQAERAAATKADAARTFSPTLFQQADDFAKRAETRLAGGDLTGARDAYRAALWYLPALPPHFPEHVARVYGSLKLRHARTVTALAYSPDGSRLATASAD